MSELQCKKASILILSEIVRRCKRQDFAKSSWADDFNPSPWQVSRKGQGGRKGQIQQKCFAACVKIPHSHRVYELECTIIVKSCVQCKERRQGCQTESKHGLHASKFCWVTPLMRLGLSTQQWDSCIFLQQWINWGCCMQEIHLKMHPLLEMPSGNTFATFYCKRPETWSHDSQFQIINKRTNKIVSRIWKSCIYIL